MRAISPTAGVSARTTASATRNPQRTSMWALKVSSIRLRRSRAREASHYRLFRAVEAIACIAETGDDVAALVQPPVDRSDDDLDVGVLGLDVSDPFGRSDDGDEPHRFRAGPL